MKTVLNDDTSVRALIEAGALQPHFQPICDIRSAVIFGYESLIRGPDNSPLKFPDDLFSAARAQGCEIDLELHCAQVALRDFGRRGLPGKIFINMSAAALLSQEPAHIMDRLQIAQCSSLPPGRIVIELTEHVRVATDAVLREALKPLRKLGIGLALDDFGDGHSSLKQWTLLKPDYVKIDKHFVQGIHASNEHLEILRVYLYVAERFNTALIAEGIEDFSELGVIRELAVHFGQGYLIGRPTTSPPREIPEAVRAALVSSKIAVLPETGKVPCATTTIENLMMRQDPIAHTATALELEAAFRRLQVNLLAVVDGHRPVGIINRQSFNTRFAQPFQRELYGRNLCTTFMNGHPTIVEVTTSIEQLFEIMKGEDQRYLVDGFVVCEHGHYVGVATGERVVRALTEFRVEAARHANPLTALPGNIPISNHIQRLLKRSSTFVACYFDLVHFKPFNDVYGYWRGDEMIRLLATTLTANCDPRHDFVGHVGGDDFVVLFQSDDWELRCRVIQQQFDSRAPGLFNSRDREAGFVQSEDRRGNPACFPLTTVMIGVALIEPGTFLRPEDVASAAADAKRKAMESPGRFHIQRYTGTEVLPAFRLQEKVLA